MRGIAGDMGTFFVVALIVAAILGWVLIEFVLWLFSFVTISFG
jgi:hypothetical protein